MARAGLALGSNLGDRLVHLQAALRLLRAIAVPGTPVLQAPVYQTMPVLCPDGSPDFLNTVVEIDFAGTAHKLLAHTQEIERQLGRVRSAARNAPRVIDVDLLYLGDAEVAEAGLELPHPRLRQRRFVLQPLVDIRPDLVLPGDDVALAGHLGALDGAEPELVRVCDEW